MKQEKNKKWFKKWWGIVLIILIIIFLFLATYFFHLVFKFKKEIERGDILIENPIGRYSSYQGSNIQTSLGRSDLEIGDNPTLGTNDPMMTIVVFSDFNCAYCRIFSSILKEFVTEYKDRVKLIFRDFPLSGEKPALAANCADEQGKFWEMHDKLFYYQNSLTDDFIPSIAEEIGLNIEQFNDCYQSEKYLSAIQKDFTAGVEAGLEGTPTIFVNGTKFKGVVPKNFLEKMLYALFLENSAE